jgi:sortase A
MAGRRSRKEDMSASLDVAPPDNRLIIPKIGKNVPLISATSAALKREDWKTFEADIQDALLLGVVRYPGTAEPGELGNVFITGHSSNYPWIFSKYNAVLARLPTLEIGDEYSVYYEGKLHRYRIAKKFEVSPKDVSVLEQPRDRYMSTLMTCVPIGTTLRRLVLQADEVNPLSSQLLRPGA